MKHHVTLCLTAALALAANAAAVVVRQNKAASPATQLNSAAGINLPDGRIAQGITAADFDTDASVFQSANVKGLNLKFADIIQFPTTAGPSLFDKGTNTKAFSVGITDASIFVPGGAGGKPQTQFRRVDLLPAARTVAGDSAVTGVRTMHFTVQQDTAKPLNLTGHEYQVAFVETADFASRQFDVRVGTGGTSKSLTGGNIVVLGRSGDNIKEMFVTPFDTAAHNFAVTLDFDKNTMQVFHSTGTAPLKAVSKTVANDNSGKGEYHFALLKLDAKGQQPANIDERLIFSGIFMEDSANGQVTLQ